MFKNLLVVSTFVLTLIAGSAFAQDEQPSDDPEITYEDLADGALYFGDSFTDWRLRCQKSVSAEDLCQVHQLLAGPNGGTIAQIAFFNLTNAQSTAVAGANVTVPLETALPEGVKFKIDDKPAKAYPFSYCDSIGCHARLGFTAVELKWLQDGAVAKMATVPYRGNREPIVIDISLAGFTAGYKAMVDNNLAN
jgi:invasion protein IalB